MAAPDVVGILDAIASRLQAHLDLRYAPEVMPQMPELVEADRLIIWCPTHSVQARRISGRAGSPYDEALTVQIHCVGFSASGPAGAYRAALALAKRVRDILAETATFDDAVARLGEFRSVTYAPIDGQHCEATLVYSGETES